MSIFKAYDIRGLVPAELNPEIGKKIANAMVQYLDAKKIIVLRDMRTHSPEIAEAVATGVTDAGCDVLDCGFGTTPMSYFLNGKLGCDGSIMVTASHNPAQYNGFKVCRGNAVPMSSETGIGEIEKIYNSGEYLKADKPGNIAHGEHTDEYVEHLLSFADNIKPLKVTVDCANGACGPFVEKMFDKLPCELTGLYMEPDGSFPNHEANPLKAENLVDLQKLMRESGAEIGMSFDGDGDRCRVLDENAEPVASDLVTTLLALEYLKQVPGTHIIYDLRSSWVLPEKVREAGGIPVRERVGHSFMKMTMRKVDGAFGGELSGHYYFKENYFSDSALLAMIKLLNIVSKKGETVSELIDPLKLYHATGEINFIVDDQDAKIKEVESAFSGGKVDYLDGVTVQFDDWWFNVRKSNTEPILRLNLEARTKEIMEQKKAEIINIIGAPE